MFPVAKRNERLNLMAFVVDYHGFNAGGLGQICPFQPFFDVLRGRCVPVYTIIQYIYQRTELLISHVAINDQYLYNKFITPIIMYGAQAGLRATIELS